ncbi:LysR family transcriptional regulator [Bradyrhizobium jicamae]|uniref:LysR family transcriptional regulator n=1 Tax=Bradyrhizobium jicamae TaxID=280332 RepID=UPI001BABAA0C|nr:LysR family transcriptional regulator [Bradyrhizobium jicamae]MBR0754340.1 LysR family transcriptional regulator [Bradyrhizobium jicamae]
MPTMPRLSGLDLVAIRSFLAVVEAGGISAAARRLGLAKSVISERITGLEKSLGVTLFNRGQNLALTERGGRLAEGMKDVIENLDVVVHDATRDRAEFGGRIRITTSAGLGVRYLGSIITAFLAEHPNVEAEITYDDRFVDIAGENYDLALRIGYLQNSDLVGRRLCSIRRLLCASPLYIEKFGVPRSVEDLRNHRGVGYTLLQSSAQWQFRTEDGKAVRSKPPRLVFLANNGEAIRDALLAGLGISNLPSFFVADDIRAGRVAMLDLGFEIAPVELWTLHSRRREPRPLAVALTSWLASRLSNPPFWENGLRRLSATIAPPRSELPDTSLRALSAAKRARVRRRSTDRATK